ncbi:MAG: hypothetical protein KIT36_19020 [Alphaproteobacteria bacterium]|nr:hypothetical protein [Alphaproteobacteria bacterium]
MKFVDIRCVGNATERKDSAYQSAVTWLAAAVRVGEHYVNNLSDVVRIVENLPKDTLVDGLFLLDHGNKSQCWVGDEDIGGATLVSYAGYKTALQKLRSHMGGEAIIHVMNCEAGSHESMLRAFAEYVGVPTYGGTGLSNPLLGFNTGSYVCAMPSGRIIHDAGRPRAYGQGG